jgi:hypothetical protein
MKILSIVLLLAMILVFVSAIVLLSKEIQKQKRLQKNSRKSPTRDKTSSASFPPLERQLYSMVGGEREVAPRLLANLRRKYPGQNEAWYWEKAMPIRQGFANADLENDRR